MARPKKHAKTGPLRAIGYLRVSTAEQADSGAGLDAQRVALSAAARERGWSLEFLADEGVTAGDSLTDGRPGLTVALGLLEAGRADVLMVSKLDRLSRSVAHGAGLLELAGRQGWAVVALDLAVDTSTPAGEMFGNVLLTMARFEKRLIGQRTKDALAAKKAAGVRLGRPPAVPVGIVSRIVAERRAGATLTAIATKLNDDQVPTAHDGAQWWPATVAAVLKGQAAAQRPATAAAELRPTETHHTPTRTRAGRRGRGHRGTVDPVQTPRSAAADGWEPAGFSAAFTTTAASNQAIREPLARDRTGEQVATWDAPAFSG